MRRHPFHLPHIGWRHLVLVVAAGSALAAWAGAPEPCAPGPMRTYSHPLMQLFDHGVPDSSAVHAADGGSRRSSR